MTNFRDFSRHLIRADDAEYLPPDSTFVVIGDSDDEGNDRRVQSITDTGAEVVTVMFEDGDSENYGFDEQVDWQLYRIERIC